MALDPRGAYGVAAGTDVYLAFKAPKAVYDTLADDLGLQKIDSAAELGKAKFMAAASAGFQRVGVNYKFSTTANRSGKLWCSLAKYEECLGGTLIGKQYRGKEIVGVFQPMDSNRS